MLDQGYSVNLYMFHRGTSFGFRNGANYGDMGYLPLVTSYDYDAALDETGRPTRKFYLFRNGIHCRTGITPPALPAPLPPNTLVEITGRVNYGPRLQDGQAGITRSVSLAGRELSGWQVDSLPMTGRRD
jgi:hypothetical protein